MCPEALDSLQNSALIIISPWVKKTRGLAQKWNTNANGWLKINDWMTHGEDSPCDFAVPLVMRKML